MVAFLAQRLPASREMQCGRDRCGSCRYSASLRDRRMTALVRLVGPPLLATEIGC
jgi:hypothetical protein